MTTAVSIFGSGNMGTALGDLLAAADISVQQVSKSRGQKITGDVVVLAVPYEALSDISKKYGKQFHGRIVVDITNPVNFDTFAELKVPVGSSAAAELQQALPGARVVKAFNTNFAATLSAGQLGGVKTTVLIAGDDDDAKKSLTGIVETCGLSAVNVGGLDRAHELEALAFLQITLANNGTINWSGGFSLNH